MEKLAFSSWGDKGARSETGEAKLPETLGDGRPVKAFMGWDGLILRDPSVNVVDMAREYMKTAQAASCGQCIPCRMGTRGMLTILERICDG